MLAQLLTEANLFSKGGKKCRIFLKMLVASARNLRLKNCANLIEYLNNIIFSEDFLSRHRRYQQDFVRQRRLPFHSMILFLMNMIKGSVQDELDYFFKAIRTQEVSVRMVTKSAFTKARKKLHHQAFIELSRNLVSFFYDHFPCRRWKGFRILAIDGSTIKVPRTKECADHFGTWTPAKGEPCPVARISTLFDAINGVVVDALIRPKEQGERSLAAEHLQQVKAKDLVLLDRGYPAFWLFALILSRQAHFCARIKSSWKEIRRFTNSGKKEGVITLPMSFVSIEQCRLFNLPIAPISVRAIRVELDNGEIEVLLTSLMDKALYPCEIFKELYRLRWTTEKNYKTAKCRIEIENFSGKSVESVCQDFHAKVFALNLTAVMTHPAQKIINLQREHKKYAYRVNITQALSKMKDAVVLLFIRSNVMELLTQLLDLFIAAIEPIRPGRKYPRKQSVQKRGFYPCYKPVR
ncbi:MAG TPA: IS4 family transposase [Dissulfurispiraceae bacterium]|nr:IS4 family transposase [Dissulfurispiraceae bacterium]